MKFILGALAFILILSFAAFVLPAACGIIIGIVLIKTGSVIGGLISIVVGILINAAMLYGSSLEGASGSGDSDEDCPYCGSGDTDGNHCYTCDDDL